MRDEAVYGLVNQVKGGLQQVIQFVNNFQQAVRLDSTGKEIRLLGLQRLLIKKGLITEAEMTEVSGEVIKEMQKQAEDAAKEAAEAAAKPAIVPATPEQTAQVTQAPATEEAVKEAIAPAVVPPQV
jgi:histone H3/H4